MKRAKKKEGVIVKAYKYRIYPSKAQITKFEQTLDICRELYNAALQERRDAWAICRKSISCIDQQNQLPEIKEIRPELRTIHSQILTDSLRRLDKAFQAFFRRVRRGERPGYPRIRSRSRYNSFGYSQYPYGGFAIRQGKLWLSRIGNVKIKLHRPIEGKIKSASITRSATGKWFACFWLECEARPLPQSIESVGIDMGITSLATLSNGEVIANPKFYRNEEKQLAKAESKRDKTSNRSKKYAKRKRTAALIHERIANKRRDFAHKESRKLADRFGIIVFEDLNMQALVKNHRLAKSISDAAWGQLIRFTAYKAEWAGRKVIRVSPCNTSKMCSGCGQLVDKDLSVRVHYCPSCGLVLDRDHNAAINILALGLQSIGRKAIEAVSV